MLDSACFLSAPQRTGRGATRTDATVTRGDPTGRSDARTCAATNSCSFSGRTSPTIGARRSSTGPPARSPPSGGQIVKVAPWGRRRLAYPIDRHREGSYHIVIFEAPAESIVELERSLLITEELLRHLVTRVERPAKSARREGAEDVDLELEAGELPSVEDEEEEETGEQIDESESEAAPAAID